MNEPLNANPMNPSSSSFSGGLESIAATCKLKHIYVCIMTIHHFKHYFLHKLEMKEPQGIHILLTIMSFTDVFQCYGTLPQEKRSLNLKKCFEILISIF